MKPPKILKKISQKHAKTVSIRINSIMKLKLKMD